MGLFGSKPIFSHKTDEQLWYEISENLSELSRRDEVDYRVRATRDSVKKKLEELDRTKEQLAERFSSAYRVTTWVEQHNRQQRIQQPTKHSLHNDRLEFD